MAADFNLTVFVVSVAVILLTPGPTNTLLAAAGAERSARAMLPLLAAELVGYLIAISVWGIILAPIQHRYPWLAIGVRVASSCYLTYIAVKLWHTARAMQDVQQKTIGPRGLLAVTLLNPKGLLFATTIFPSRAFDDMQVYSVAMVLFACLLLPIGMLWGRFGAALGSGRLRYMTPAKLQRTAALVIGAFSASIAWATFH
jgi:threonine/homoserine/homoserine lactone efflux protein